MTEYNRMVDDDQLNEQWKRLVGQRDARIETLTKALEETYWMITDTLSGEGTDKQALDHIARRLQEKFNGPSLWVAEALHRAMK